VARNSAADAAGKPTAASNPQVTMTAAVADITARLETIAACSPKRNT
jgi:hypothetical protein